jgi:hypothetical protein
MDVWVRQTTINVWLLRELIIELVIITHIIVGGDDLPLNIFDK